MPLSQVLGDILTNATGLAKDLHHNQVEPLHFVAAMLTQETSATAEILKQLGISRAAVIAAIRK